MEEMEEDSIPDTTCTCGKQFSKKANLKRHQDSGKCEAAKPKKSKLEDPVINTPSPFLMNTHLAQVVSNLQHCSYIK